MKIFSAFDGISCLQETLNRLKIPVSKYYSSEINKYAQAITKHNFPKTIFLGNIEEIAGVNDEIDLLAGGSPCTDFSTAGKGKGMSTTEKIEITTLEKYLELKGCGYTFSGQSYLFWEFIRLRDSLKPKYILLENVRMIQKWQDVLSKAIGFQPVVINSNLVSAQNRHRLYWFGERQEDGTYKAISIDHPIDKGILLKDIVHEKNDQKINIDNYKVPFNKSIVILNSEVSKGKIGFFRKDSQANRVYSIHGKGVALCGASGGGAAKMGQYLFGCITPDRLSKRQNGQRFNDGKKFYTLTAIDRHGVIIDGYIRKLTPVECERLQTLPDDYTKIGNFEGVEKEISNSQRYKAIGNGWTVDAIAHILSNIYNH